MLWPVVECFGVKIGPVRPYQCVYFRVDRNLIEEGRLTQWPKQLTGQNRLEINRLLRLIVKLHPQSLGADDLDRFHAVDTMGG